MEKMKVLILSGGAGTRLWPLSRSNYPKQFLPLIGESSFLQKTWERNLYLTSRENIYIVTSNCYVQDIKRLLPNILDKNIIVEPEQKNTAPAILLSLEQMDLEEEEIVLVCPADHLITPNERYADCINSAKKSVLNGKLVTFGVRPSKPETGYGYIQAEKNRVLSFVEKPNLSKAVEYLQRGDFFWNSGMFSFTKKTFFSELKKYCPELDVPFEKMPKISLDYALMEKSQNVAMICLDLTWSDIGSFENLYESMQKDKDLNATKGDVLAVDTESCLILSNHRHVSALGVNNLLIIETDDAVLVADKRRSQEVKNLVQTLTKLGKKQIREHSSVERPWGSYTVLLESDRYKIKQICVKPMNKLSLQLHYHRSEHWIVVSGTAKVTLSDREIMVHEGESIFVPKSSIHRIENPGKVLLEIVEIQVGEYLEEDDIVRLEDIYGRMNPNVLEKLSSIGTK